MRKNIPVLLLTLLLVTFQSAFAGQNEIVKGTANFILDRAEESLISMFEDSIPKNKFMAQHFKRTVKALETLNLKVLMLNPSLCQESIQGDLDAMKDDLQKELIDNGYNKTLSDVRQQVIALKPSQNKGFSLMSVSSKNESEAYTKAYKILTTIEQPEVNTKENIELAKYIQDLDKLVPKPPVKNKENVKDVFEVSISSELINSLSEINKASEYVKNIQKYEGSNKVKFIEKTSQIFLLIESMDKFRKEFDCESKDYKKFKNIALFFAQIADVQKEDGSNSQETMKAILKAYALPPNSYQAKRKDSMRFSISAYLGGAAGASTENRNWDKYYGVVAPIGIEYCVGTKGHASNSFMLSFVDLGSAVNSQIYNTNEAFTFQDVMAPGLVYLHGFEGVPLSFGAGYFKVRGLKDKLSDEQRAMVFLAVDIPLFGL